MIITVESSYYLSLYKVIGIIDHIPYAIYYILMAYL